MDGVTSMYDIIKERNIFLTASTGTEVKESLINLITAVNSGWVLSCDGIDEVLNDVKSNDSVKAFALLKELKGIGSGGFESCPFITTLTLTCCEAIGSSAFRGCASLTDATFPVCTSIGYEAFCMCESLISVDFPVCTTTGSDAFAFCSSLTNVNFPMCTTIEVNAFTGCQSLSTATFPECASIGSYAFYDCSSLTALYLTGSSVVTLARSNAFTGTPIASGTGLVYVPSSLYSDYISNSVWSWFSSAIARVEV